MITMLALLKEVAAAAGVRVTAARESVIREEIESFAALREHVAELEIEYEDDDKIAAMVQAVFVMERAWQKGTADIEALVDAKVELADLFLLLRGHDYADRKADSEVKE